MKNLLVLSAFIFISLLTQNCSKSQIDKNANADQIDMKQLLDCYTSQKYDSTKLASQLIGNWKWIESYAYAIGTAQADKTVILSLTQSGTYTVTENSIRGWNEFPSLQDAPSLRLFNPVGMDHIVAADFNP